MHPRVGHNRIGCEADEIAIEEQVEIEGAGRVLGVPDSPELLLDAQKESQQTLGSDIGLEESSGVEVSALIGRTANGGSLIIRRDPRNPHTRLGPQTPHGPIEGGLPVSEIAAQRNRRHGHGRLLLLLAGFGFFPFGFLLFGLLEHDLLYADLGQPERTATIRPLLLLLERLDALRPRQHATRPCQATLPLQTFIDGHSLYVGKCPPAGRKRPPLGDRTKCDNMDLESGDKETRSRRDKRLACPASPARSAARNHKHQDEEDRTREQARRLSLRPNKLGNS